MSINWEDLRTLDNSQNTAFEELICQLARYEQIPPGSYFIRNAAPDAGVECYWQLPNGEEWGWQAKFFREPPGEIQWRQIAHSFEVALEKHPNLKRYFVCLPIDQSDPRKDAQKWFRDKWTEYVQKWENIAKQQNKEVQILYWGQHEIFERLSRQEHAGRYYFWFKKDLFSNQWFTNRIEEKISDACERYTPEIHVDLPIRYLFDGLTRDVAYYGSLKMLYGKVKQSYNKTQSRNMDDFIPDFSSFKQEIVLLLYNLETAWMQEGMKSINFDLIKQLSESQRSRVSGGIENLINAQMEAEKSVTKTIGNEQNHRDYYEGLGYKRSLLTKLSSALTEVIDFTNSAEAKLGNLPVLLIVGQAGKGKTHLFCDVAKKRSDLGLPTVLLFGEQFTKREPWSQIIELLGLTCNKDELLGALEASAQIRGSRALILMDALNEGEGRFFWKKYIAGMLTTLSRYPWIAVAFSVRESYEDIIIPEGLAKDKLVRTVHEGFANYEYIASKKILSYYKIEQPSIPLLNPEFQNPLFLKLLCVGLNNQKMTKIPRSLYGITSMFDFFIDSINQKLAEPDRLGFDRKSKIVQHAVETLVGLMADKAKPWLLREEARAAVEPILPNIGHDGSLFNSLIAEGIIAEEVYRTGQNQFVDGVHFSYERFSDHLIVKQLIKRHISPNDPSIAFLPNQPLGYMIKDLPSCRANRGFIEALSIQLPEQIHKELIELAAQRSDYKPIKTAFIESMIWRDATAFSNSTLDYINKYFITQNNVSYEFLNALITIASIPDHPYNANFINERLMSYELADRDSWWSVFLHYQYGAQGSVDRLIDWAWSQDDKSYVCDQSIKLCGITLCWFLTCPNRFLRDRATKALVCMLSNRIHVLRDLIKLFVGVNDPYVLERLYAVAYGCSMRCIDDQSLGQLAEDIYKQVFQSCRPVPHILLRDYARGTIEYALHRGLKIKVVKKRIRPPYQSDWPSFKIPSKQELWGQYGESNDNMSDKQFSSITLYNSVMNEMSDFCSYKIAVHLRDFLWPASFLLDEYGRLPEKQEEYSFYLSLASRWILKRVTDLGWSAELFGEFDREMTRNTGNRDQSKPERMGKKYQWIAYHEFLARITDNFGFIENPWKKLPSVYQGPWQLSVRDIDPSMLLKTTFSEPIELTTNEALFEPEIPDIEWLTKSDNLPDFPKLIERREVNNNHWIVLEGHYDWIQPTPLGEEKYETPKRHVSFEIKSYFVKKADAENLVNWAKEKVSIHGVLPENSGLSDIFFGEFYWSPAYRYFNNPYYNHIGWTNGSLQEIPQKVMLTTDAYLREQGYDCSIDESLRIHLPTELIVNSMELNWTRQEGRLFDRKDALISFDPTTESENPELCVFRRNSLIEFLEKNGLDILWIVYGRKEIIGGSYLPDNWKGEQEINGIYTMSSTKIDGTVNAVFNPPNV